MREPPVDRRLDVPDLLFLALFFALFRAPFFADRVDEVFRADDRERVERLSSGSGGTFAPFLRASLRPIATACLRLVTLRPDPLRSVPCFRRRIADSTVFDAFLPYFATTSSFRPARPHRRPDPAGEDVALQRVCPRNPMGKRARGGPHGPRSCT